MTLQKTTYLSIGTNKGNLLQNLQSSLYLLDEHVGQILKVSSVYKTKAWGFTGNDFLNICVKISTKLPAKKLLKATQEIEISLGRTKTKSYSNRIIDIDILFFENEIISLPNLTVPHKHLAERNFVLIPLAEIANSFLHPVYQKQIGYLAKNCTDNNAIKKTNAILQRPIPISEKYNYIAIEGNIGVGKTSLAKMISEDFNAKLILERFADNPFLPKFYKDKERYAFSLEMSFLADRYQQLTEDLAQFNLFKSFVISDYYIFKSLIFAQITLQKDELFLYRKMFDIMYKEITKPDLYIYLHQSTSRLLKNIKKRGRNYEQDIPESYLDNLHKGYSTFIKTEKKLNTLIIDVSNQDFVTNKLDYKTIIKKIKEG